MASLSPGPSCLSTPRSLPAQGLATWLTSLFPFKRLSATERRKLDSSLQNKSVLAPRIPWEYWRGLDGNRSLSFSECQIRLWGEIRLCKARAKERMRAAGELEAAPACPAVGNGLVRFLVKGPGLGCEGLRLDLRAPMCLGWTPFEISRAHSFSLRKEDIMITSGGCPPGSQSSCCEAATRIHIAVAAGANMILGPGQYVAESALHMPPADSQSRMWDADASGYTRGEGVAAVILKRLSTANADRDKIECIRHETVSTRTNGPRI
ncbi:hypothetical protein B0T19DRAFT_175856 [Cercophora scortea]|uniref:Beta-ketoacyl synthase-like N-terminal domain-containing protein n=1 Tax=Cercophora scortea TaxID=314031 RepID=A0AAE0IMW3_9PEZI|nr:hypothetical protein B0T19DRAFT_175856 [Cercophora scortea]